MKIERVAGHVFNNFISSKVIVNREVKGMSNVAGRPSAQLAKGKPYPTSVYIIPKIINDYNDEIIPIVIHNFLSYVILNLFLYTLNMYIWKNIIIFLFIIQKMFSIAV